MVSAVEMITLSFGISFWLLGIILNSSIVAVYFRDWKNGISPGDCDQIILAMGLTNILLQCLFSTDGLMSFVDYANLCAIEVFLLAQFLIPLLVSIIFYHTALLSFYYCMKLTNCSHRVFNHMKMRISCLVTYLQLGSITVAFVFNIPFFWMVKINIPQNMTQNPFCKVSFIKVDFQYLTISKFFCCALPLILTLIFLGFSLTPVLGHIWRMKQNASGFQSPQIEGHMRAARTMVLLVIVDLFLFMTNIFGLIISANYEHTMDILSSIAVWSYPSAISITLIIGNPKLRSEWSRVHRQIT